MRLKFLFFPIMFVISFSIFIGYIWPEINNVKKINTEKLANTQALQAVKDKQSAIELLGTQILNDSDGSATIKSYLPDKKVEERIIGGINYLAADSGVMLVNIYLKKSDVADLTNGAQQNAASVKNSSASLNNPANGQVLTDEADGLRFNDATILVNGEYEKIRLFIDQLQKISLLNNIKSLTITNKKKSYEGETEETNPDPSNLSADIVMSFGYLPSLSLDNNKISKFKPEMDNNAVGILKQYVSQKTESVAAITGGIGNKGKANPFLP